MNVLLTSAGRRGYLVEYFRQALAGSGGRVIAADAAATAPALALADEGVCVPPVDDPAYVERLLEVAGDRGVGLLVPLNDHELPVLARQRERFARAGVRALVGEPGLVDDCFDKWRTVARLADLGLACPRSFLTVAAAREALARGEVRLPLVVKPRWGTASLGVERVHAEAELAPRVRLLRAALARTGGGRGDDRTVLIQEQVEGQEYGLDVVNDLDGRHRLTVCKRKLVMRAGETDRAVTVEAPELAELGARLGTSLAHPGLLDCDVFRTPAGPVVLEANPRFGGGYPFSHLAGLDLPAALVAWARGREPDPAWRAVRPGVASAKTLEVVVVPAPPTD